MGRKRYKVCENYETRHTAHKQLQLRVPKNLPCPGVQPSNTPRGSVTALGWLEVRKMTRLYYIVSIVPSSFRAFKKQKFQFLANGIIIRF